MIPLMISHGKLASPLKLLNLTKTVFAKPANLILKSLSATTQKVNYKKDVSWPLLMNHKLKTFKKPLSISACPWTGQWNLKKNIFFDKLIK